MSKTDEGRFAEWDQEESASAHLGRDCGTRSAVHFDACLQVAFIAGIESERTRTRDLKTCIAEAVTSAALALTTHPRDAADDHRDAWVYGILVGWGDALPEVAKRHGWTSETVMRMERYRTVLEEFKGAVRK